MRDQIVVIPSYQPSEQIIPFAEELGRVFEKVIIVDDGSGELYHTVFHEIEKIPHCEVLYHAVNQGKGRALKTAFNHCLRIYLGTFSGVITVDGDGQHKTEDIVCVSDTMRHNPNAVVLGCRSFKDRAIPLRSRLGNGISKVLYRWMCGVDVSDTQTGLRGLPFVFLRTACSVEGERYEYETNMLIAAEKSGVCFVEVPIQTIYEDGNKGSHFNPIRDSIKIYLVIFKYCLSSMLSVFIDYVVFILLLGTGVSIIEATYFARMCSALINFMINRNVVFEYKGNFIVQLVKYFLLVFVSGTCSGVLITWVTKRFFVPVMIVKILAESALFFVNYYVQRKFVFARRERKA